MQYNRFIIKYQKSICRTQNLISYLCYIDTENTQSINMNIQICLQHCHRHSRTRHIENKTTHSLCTMMTRWLENIWICNTRKSPVFAERWQKSAAWQVGMKQTWHTNTHNLFWTNDNLMQWHITPGTNQNHRKKNFTLGFWKHAWTRERDREMCRSTHTNFSITTHKNYALDLD